MSAPLAIDLYCGLGGWTEALLAEGWDVIGFDIERHDYGTGGYPGQLVLQDVCTLHGAQFRDADLIVASPPCQEFSYRAMPWKRAKALPPPYLGMNLFWQCWRIQHEAIEATRKRCWNGHLGKGWALENCLECQGVGYTERHIPLIVENVVGAQKWIGGAAWHYGSFYLWGDIPSLMPHRFGQKVGIYSDPRRNSGKTARLTSPQENLNRLYADRDSEGTKQHGSGPVWWRTGNGAMPSNSPRRKAASAQIAKIPQPFALWIAKTFKPS